MEKENGNLRIIHTLSHPGEQWNGKRGHIDIQIVREEIPDYDDRVFYVCGTPSLVADCVSVLKALRIPDDKINKEDFPGY
jgi:ferredoxin-NADP reductase